jgi:PEP-CTERM motif
MASVFRIKGGLMVSKRFSGAAVAAIALVGSAAGPANSAVVIDITQSGANVDVTVSGDLNLEGATLFSSQGGFGAGIIPGGDNWYVTAGADGAQNLYELTGVTLPFGTSGNFFGSVLTQSGDAFIIWGNSGGVPIVGVPAGYTSGAISAFMEIGGETIAGMTLIPGTYTFSLPNDTITLEIGSPVPEPASWAMMLIGFAGLGFAGYRRA